MEQPLVKSFSVTGNARLYEYLLVVNPDETAYQQVMAEKENFYQEYKEKVAIKTKPHITVANFLAFEPMEETISRWMQRIISMHPSFTVMLNNFSGFPPHTVYVRVQNHKPFREIAKQLKTVDHYIKSYGCPGMRLITNPHLTIARRLPEKVYEKAIFDYSRKDFNTSFKVNELLLLKRLHQFDTCKRVNIFSLNPSANNLFE